MYFNVFHIHLMKMLFHILLLFCVFLTSTAETECVQWHIAPI